MEFEVTFDYLCPFARNLSEAVFAGIEAGQEWAPRFRPFSLGQSHRDDDAAPVWDIPEDERPSGVLALQWGLAIRDKFPEQFPKAHLSLFAARHDRGENLNDPAVLREAVERADLDPDLIEDLVSTGEPLRALGVEHSAAVDEHAVFGVPTVIHDGEAVYLRIMERADATTLQGVLDMIPVTTLNEFKRTRIPR